MEKEGILIVVSGFSGVGKGTLTKELIRRYPDRYALSISATSRKPRTGETEGTDYFFKTREEFEKMIADDCLIEHAEYNGNYYGTPREFVQNQMKSGKNVILEIEVQGGLQIKSRYPETCLMYVIPPSAEVLFERLKGRGTEDIDTINQRIARAVEECDYVSNYDMIVENDDFETCLNEMHQLLMKKQDEINGRHIRIAAIKEELTELSKGE